MKWRRIPGWPEYKISEFGDIKRAMVGQGAVKGAVLSPHKNVQTGYLCVDLYRNSKRTKYSIHHLVLVTFVGLPPTDKHEVAHFDGSRDNNHYSNLRWATRSENHLDKWRHGTLKLPMLKGVDTYNAKLNDRKIRKIRRLRINGYSQRRLAKIFKVHRSTICDIIKDRTWRHVV